MMILNQIKVLYSILLILLSCLPVYSIAEIISFPQELQELNKNLEASIVAGDTVKSRLYINLIQTNLNEKDVDSLTSSNSRYYIGVYYLLTGKYLDAINWFRSSSLIRDQLKCFDQVYSKCIYNIAIGYNNLGDYKRMEEYALKAHEIDKNIFGSSSPELIQGLSVLQNAYINLYDYSSAIYYGNLAVKLIEGSDKTYRKNSAIVYINLGTCHALLSDYSKALLFLEKAESIYITSSLQEDNDYINLLNNLGATYFFLGQFEKSDYYFDKGLSKIKISNSATTFNFLNSFAVMLGNGGDIKKGETILLSSLGKAENFFGRGSRNYYEVVKNLAEYLRIFNIDNERSIQLYEQCIIYLENHQEDITLSRPVYLGYALALNSKGESGRAMTIIQNLLFPDRKGQINSSSFTNPEINSIKADQWTIKILQAKHKILWDMYTQESNYSFILAAFETSELIVGTLDKLRLNISEEESRLLLGDRFRDSYMFSLNDINFCYNTTGNKKFLEKAFEYSERSKVAGLLASTRELKATQLHIPPEIAELERKLKSEISYYNAKIEEENFNTKPDQKLVSEWNELIINATQKKDSLINLLEKQYPEYYLIKYNTQVIKPEDLTEIGGRNVNYLNYVVSDTVLYIILSNRKNLELITIPLDSGFYRNLREFRELLTHPQNDALSDFNRYMESGSVLYETLISPVREYFISNKLLVSPDGILSYIPFEALPVVESREKNVLFNRMSYLMNEFNISYTYSGTLLSEVNKKNISLSNKLIAFAPIYPRLINTDSILKTRQPGVIITSDLPYARIEAGNIADMTSGKLYLNDSAREGIYKSEAGKYDIIHLAMHTILNDQYPMYSKLVFYQEKDSVEDGNLNTYEVYGIPLKAKMVTLSSCNTGSGILRSGEGIMSLARGFIYSGCQSVVMSMWEIEDRSGADIVESYYRFLKRGFSKSSALRKARMKYLRDADMLRSHPYFWSSLVIYGNDKPLYTSILTKGIIAITLILITLAIFLNYRKSK